MEAERVIVRSETLTGPEKAAALLLSLPSDQVTKIFEKLEPSEIHEISQIMSSLGKVKAEALNGVYQEFTDNLSTTGNLRGNFDTTERLLAKVMDQDKAKAIMEDIRGPMGRTVWDKLSNISTDILAEYLKNEYPQTVAVILSKIRPENASKIFQTFPQEFAQEVVERMLRMESVKREVIDNIEKSLRTEFMMSVTKTAHKDPHETVANIFNAFDRTTEGKFMTYLRSKMPDSAEKIKALMFTFDDLVRLDAAGIQTLIRFADKSKLVLSLKGSAENIKDMFFSNMSERAAKLMKEEMESLGMVRLKEVEEAQLEVVNVAKSLAERGEIKIKASGATDEAMVS